MIFKYINITKHLNLIISILLCTTAIFSLLVLLDFHSSTLVYINLVI